MKLKNEISSFLVNYKKKYQRFPWSQVNKVSKIKLYSSTPITVNGSKFTVKELVKVMNMTKKKINGKLKPSSYNYILKAYIRDSYKQSGSNLKSIYNSYHTELQKVFKEMDYDLMFCLNGLKELNKTLKDSQRKVIKESTNKDDTLDLSNFDKKVLDKKVIDKYKADYSFLKHVDLDDDSYVWFDNDKIVAILMIDNKGDNDIWITGLEVSKEYRGYGLGKQILNFAIQKLRVNALSVRKNNKIAIDMYKKAGFEFDKKDHGSMYFMSLTNKRDQKDLKESEDINMDNDELLLALIESDLGFEDDDVFEEGVNTDIKSSFSDLKHEYTVISKRYRDHLKNNEIDKAKSDLKVMKSIVDKVEKTIRDTDSTAGDIFLSTTSDLAMVLITSLIVTKVAPSVIQKGGKAVEKSFENSRGAKKRKEAYLKAKDEHGKKLDEKYKAELEKLDRDKLGEAEYSRRSNRILFDKIIPEEEKFEDSTVAKKHKKDKDNLQTIKAMNTYSKTYIEIIKKTYPILFSTKVLINNVKQTINRARKDGKITVDTFNMYKTRILKCIGQIKKDIGRMEKELESAERKLSKAVKESEDINMDNDELLLALIESDLGFEDDDVFEEGVNTDIKDEFKKLKSEYKALSKKYDQNLKEGNFEEARRNVKLMSKVVDRTESTIKDLKGGVDTAILGFVLNNLKQIVISLLIRLGSKVVIKNEANKLVKSGIWSVGDNDTININVNKLKDNFDSTLGSAIKVRLSCRAKSIQNINDTLKVIVDTIGIVQRAKKDGELSIDTFNVYKNKVLFCVKNIKDDVRSLEKEIDEAEKKAVKSVKESEDIKMNNDELLLALIESELGFEDDEIFEEKANENIKDKYNDATKEFNEQSRKCKIFIRENKFEYAEKCLDKMEKIIADAKNMVRESKSDALDIVVPSAAGFLKTTLGVLAGSFVVSCFTTQLKDYASGKEEFDRIVSPKIMAITTAATTALATIPRILEILKEAKELDVKGKEKFNKCKMMILKDFAVAEKVIKELKKELSNKKKYIAKLEIDLDVRESEDVDMDNDDLLLSIIESELAFEDDDIFEEGVNKDIGSEFKKLQAEYKILSKKCKENIKDGKFADARRNTKLMAKVVDKTEATIKDLKGDVGAAVLGTVMANLKMMVSLLIVSGVSLGIDKKLSAQYKKSTFDVSKSKEDTMKDYDKIDKKREAVKYGTIGYVSARATLQLISDTMKVIKRAKEEGQLTADTFNAYKSNALTCVKRLKKDVLSLEKDIEKAEKAVKAVKESYDEEYDNELLAIIAESYLDDDIFEEATDKDDSEIIKELGVNYKKLSKECKQKLDKGDFAGARKKLKEMRAIVEKAKNSVSKIAPERGKEVLRKLSFLSQSFIIGLGLNASASILYDAGKNSTSEIFIAGEKGIKKKNKVEFKKIPGELKKSPKKYVNDAKENGRKSALASDALYTAAGVAAGAMIVKIIEDIKNGKVNEDTFNVYRTRMVDIFKCIEKEMDRLEKAINKAEKAAKAVKESYDEEYDNELLAIIAESYLDDDFDEEFVTEGANLESRKIFVEAKKDYKKLLKEYKKNVKSANFKEARKNVKDIKVVLVKASKALDSEKGGVNSAILGNMAVFMKDFMVGFSAALPGSVGMGFTSVLAMKGKTITPVIGGISVGAYYIGLIVSAVYGAKATIKDVVSIINAIKQEKNVTADVFNRYRLRLSQKMDDLIDATEKMNKHIDEVESAYKEAVKTKNQKEKVAKESAEFDAEKLAIYESCHRGEITVEEREELLSELEDKRYVNEAIEVEESVVTNYEKFGKVAEVLYERCANGEITVEDRENLLAKAKEMIL